MNTYRIFFLDWTTKEFLETGEPVRHRDYRAPNAAGALRTWMNHYYGYAAESIERLPKERENHQKT
jgi:hypothetical protein